MCLRFLTCVNEDFYVISAQLLSLQLIPLNGGCVSHQTVTTLLKNIFFKKWRKIRLFLIPSATNRPRLPPSKHRENPTGGPEQGVMLLHQPKRSQVTPLSMTSTGCLNQMNLKVTDCVKSLLPAPGSIYQGV